MTGSDAAVHMAKLIEILNDHVRRIRGIENCPMHPIVTPIANALLECRRSLPEDEWRDSVCPELRSHEMMACLHQDPYSSHAFQKPRGYPGDAVLMDYIYGGGMSSHSVRIASPLGAALYRECYQHPSSAAIRNRRDYLSQRLIALGQSCGCGEVLSVACGHLREAQPLEMLPAGRRPSRFVALDQDNTTLELVRAEYAAIGIQPVQASVLDLLRSGDELGTFDFIYSAGLYDYLSDSAGIRLLVKLATMLKPGGRLVIANMTPDLPSAGYMESVMDWWLIYRTEDEMTRLGAGLQAEVPGLRSVTHVRPFVAYLEIENTGQVNGRQRT